MNTLESFLEYCQDFIKSSIRDYVGQTHYSGDLPFTITQGPNCDGTLTYSRQAAMEYLQAWWWDCADYYDMAMDNFGQVRNPFDNPEAYMVCMVIEGVNSLLSQCGDVWDWKDEFELTEEMADKICEKIDELTINW